MEVAPVAPKARLEDPKPDSHINDLCPWEQEVIGALRSLKYGQLVVNMMNGHPEQMVTSISRKFGKHQA